MKKLTLLALLPLVCFGLGGCDSSEDSSTGTGGNTVGEGKKPSVAYVTNGIASFWDIAEKGAMDAGVEFDADVQVRMPPKGVEDQKRMCQDLLAAQVHGIAISPIDPDNQGDLLDEIAERTTLITHDSDAPDSKRLCYIGMDNYTAGRLCGGLVKEAMPEGGEVMIFVGRLGQANARLRRQGVIDELMDRDHDSTRYDEPGAGPIKGETYTVLDTRTDGFDFGKAKANAEDAIAAHPNLGCMVGLFAYNPPLILEAVRDANKVGKIKIVSFDEHDDSLQGIVDGEVYGTVVQNPYEYGFQSVRVLAGLARGDKSVLPEDGVMNIDARVIRKDNVDAYWTELKGLLESTAKKGGDDGADSGDGETGSDENPDDAGNASPDETVPADPKEAE